MNPRFKPASLATQAADVDALQQRASAVQPRRFRPVQWVADIYGVSAQCIWIWAREGRIPKPVKLAAQTTRWEESAILQDVAEKHAAAQQAQHEVLGGRDGAK